MLRRFAYLLCVVSCLGACRTDIELLQPGSGGLDGGAPLDGGESSMEADGASRPLGDASSLPILRYDFRGAGDLLLDSIMQKHARLHGGVLADDGGQLGLDGIDDYVDLPDAVISPLTNATIMVWYSWGGGAPWQRVFDFGVSTAGEGTTAIAKTSLYYTTREGTGPRAALVAELSLDAGLGSYGLSGSRRPIGTGAHVAVTIDQGERKIRLYEEGKLTAEGVIDFELSEFEDTNNWLGRSQHSIDAFGKIVYDELRIYDRVLSAAEIARALERGPDALD